MSQDQVQSDQDKSKEQQQQQQDGKEFEPKTPDQNDVEKVNQNEKEEKKYSVHDKFHRTLILSGFCLLKIAKISLNSSFFPKPIKR